jgi:hypothetical protein
MPDALPPIGPYISPTHTLIEATRRNIRALGGRLSHNGQIHRSSNVRYQDDPEELRRQRHPGLSGGSTCGCGRGGVLVELPNEMLGADEPDTPACIFCDGVHLMPRFAPDPEGDFS